MTDAGIAISQSLSQFAVEVEGAPPEKIHTIPYGLDFQRLTPHIQKATRQAMRQQIGLDAEAVVVGMVCRLVEQKGLSYGLQALARVLPQFPDACCVIAGEGPLRAELEAEAKALGLRDCVHFLGWRDDVADLMTALDLLLVPSLWEGFGLVILEAMARQLPVIASAVSAIPEIIVQGETGLLVPPRDVEGLAEALAMLLADRPLRRYLGQNGEDRLEAQFSARRMVDDTVTLYRKLL